eukprot:scaffold28260_cov70-Isochrysis_galbana.AAC.2
MCANPNPPCFPRLLLCRVCTRPFDPPLPRARATICVLPLNGAPIRAGGPPSPRRFVKTPPSPA